MLTSIVKTDEEMYLLIYCVTLLDTMFLNNVIYLLKTSPWNLSILIETDILYKWTAKN